MSLKNEFDGNGKAMACRLLTNNLQLIVGQKTLLLRARRERPRGRAADERDERASIQLIELHSIPASQGRIGRISNCQRIVSGYRNDCAGAVVTFMMRGRPRR